MTQRFDRIMESVPDYYSTSAGYKAIVKAQADEYDTLEAQKDDLERQGNPYTATWGLKYMEEALGITVNENDSVEARRSRVIAKRRSPGNFSAALVKGIAESFSNGEVAVRVDVSKYIVTITFIGAKGVPENLQDLQAQLENVVHAHMEIQYEYTYMTWDDLDRAQITWDQMDDLNKTWDEWERFKP